MDIDRLARRASEQLAARPSRRGIVSTIAAGAGVILAGLRGTGEAAAQDFCAIKDSCCTGACPITNESGTTTDPQSACPTGLDTCPSGYKKRYQWFCTYTDPAGGRTRQLCLDCYNSQRKYGCTVVTTR